MTLNNKDLDKISVHKMTEKEKKDISNELEQLLNNPNISVDKSLKELIKDTFVGYKNDFTGKHESNWYKIAQNFIRALKKKEIKSD